jgi:hypothetical protein
LLALLGAAAVVALLAVARADKQRVGTDFYVFWQAGYNFAHGLPLYQGEGPRTFIYPPFAAQLFQVLAVFPLKAAGALFYVASVALVAAAAWLTRDIVKRLGVEPSRHLPLILAVVFSGQFILNNLNLLQVNLVTFVLCLLAVRGTVMGRQRSAGWAAVATAVKITPVFFVVWAVIRGGWRALRAALTVGLVCLLLPVVQRGPRQGETDLVEYYSTFLQEFAAGKVVTSYTNQNLAALVFRAVTVPDSPQPFEYYYLPSLQSAAPLIYRALALAVLSVFLIHLVRLAKARRPITAWEIGSVFLTAHLLSGITWKAHLVTLLFVFYTFLCVDPHTIEWRSGWALRCAWLGIAVIGLAGRDLVGTTAHHYLGGYSVFVWVMLGLLVLSIAWSSRPPAPAPPVGMPPP